MSSVYSVCRNEKRNVEGETPINSEIKI